MNKHNLKVVVLSLSTALLLGITGCSSDSSNDDTSSSGSGGGTPPTAVSYSGIGIDGILVGSTVCVDVNTNNACDSGEPSAITDADGKFTIPATTETGPLLLIGGIDNSTGAAFTGSLKAPAGSTVVTPLTSAVQSLVESGKSAADAEASIKTAMGLTNVDLTTFDPYAEIDGVNAETAKAVLAKQTQLQVLVHAATVTVAGADENTDVNSTMSSVFDAIAANFDGATAEVTLDATAVSAATKVAAESVYKNNQAARVAAKVVARTSAESSVRDADDAQEAISSGNASDAVSNLDAAIAKANTTAELELRAAAEAAKIAAVLHQADLDEIERLQRIQEEQEAKIAAARAAQAKAEADAAAAKAEADRIAADAEATAADQKAAYDAQLAAELEAQRQAAAKAAADEAAAKAAKDAAEAEKAIAAAEAAQREAEAAAAEARAKAEKDAADARAEAAQNALDAAALETSLADAQAKVHEAEVAAADGIARANISSNKQIANFIVVQMSNENNLTQTIATALADSNATNQATASAAAFATAQGDLANLVSLVDSNSTDVNSSLSLKVDIELQATIVTTALNRVQQIKSAKELEAAATVALQAKEARITVKVESVRAIFNDLNSTFNDLNTSAIDENVFEINAVAQQYLQNIELQEANTRAIAANSAGRTAFQLAETKLDDVRNALTNVNLALVALNEADAESAAANALVAKGSFETAFVTVNAKVQEIETILNRVREIKAQEEATATQQITASRIAATAALEAAQASAVLAENSYTQAVTDSATMNTLDQEATSIDLSNEVAAATNEAEAIFAKVEVAVGAAAEAAQAQETAANTTSATVAQAAATQAAEKATLAAQAAGEAAQAAASVHAQLIALQATIANAGTGDSNTSALAFVEGMTLSDFDLDNGKIKVGTKELGANNQFLSTREVFDYVSNTFIVSPDSGSDNEDLELDSAGNWVAETDSITYQIVDGNILFPNGFEVKMMTKINLATPSAEDSAIIASINQHVPGDANVTFSAGSEAYILGFRAPESYRVGYTPTVQEQNSNGDWYDTNVTFTTILDYMGSVNSVAGFYDGDKNEWIGVDFARIDDQPLFHSGAVIDSSGSVVSTLTEGLTGNLVTVNASDAQENRVQVPVGTWRVVALPHSAGLALIAEPSSSDNEYLFDGDQNKLVAVVNAEVKIGEYESGSTTFYVDDESIEFNDVATQVIKAAITDYIVNNPTPPLSFHGSLPAEAGGEDVNVTVNLLTGVISGTVGENVVTGNVDEYGQITSQTATPDGTVIVNCTGNVNSDGTVTINATPVDTTINPFSYTLYPEGVNPPVVVRTEFTVDELTASPQYYLTVRFTENPDPIIYATDMNFTVDGNVTITEDNITTEMNYTIVDGVINFSNGDVMFVTNDGSDAGVHFVDDSYGERHIFTDEQSRDEALQRALDLMNAPQLALGVEKLTITENSWTWADQIRDESGGFSDDPDSVHTEAIEVTDNVISILDDNNDSQAIVKFIAELNASTFNATYGTEFVNANFYTFAYIRFNDERDSWGEAVRDYNTDSTFATVSDMLNSFVENNSTFSDDTLPKGEGYAFNTPTEDNNGTIRIINSEDGSLVADNVGTYTISNDEIITYKANDNGEHDAFFVENGEVVYGDFMEAGSGGIGYFTDETGLTEFTAYFDTATDILDEIHFGENRFNNWETDFSNLGALDVTTLPSALYEIGVERQ